MGSFLGVLTLVVVAATTAHAQSVGPPSYSVGDTWTFTNREQKVVKIDGDMVVMNGVAPACPTCLYHLDKNLVVQKVEQENGQPVDPMKMGFLYVGPDWKFWDFPLQVNKEWRISAVAAFRGTPNNYTIDCKVESYEDIKTQAGTFKTFKVRRSWAVRDRYQGRDSKWSDTVWFAPEVKVAVKFTTESRAIPEWELTAYSLK